MCYVLRYSRRPLHNTIGFEMENTSGTGTAAVVPPEIDRWNWGAFLLNWIWGIGNSTFIALLCFVPFVNIVMPFVLGAKGSAWAWRNKRWESVESFKSTQRTYAWVGLALVVIPLLLATVLIAVMPKMLRNSDVYQMAVKELNENPHVIQILGQPIQTGIPGGSINVSGPNGEASLSFSAKGPKGDGTVYVNASKSLGQWKFDDFILEDGKSKQRTDLMDGAQ